MVAVKEMVRIAARNEYWGICYLTTVGNRVIVPARSISELMTARRTGGRLARTAGTQKKSDPSESSIL